MGRPPENAGLEQVHDVYGRSARFLLCFFSGRSGTDRCEMKGERILGRKRATVLVGILLIAGTVAGMIALGGVTVDRPFTMGESDNDTDTPRTAGSEETADEGAAPAGEETSTMPPSTPLPPEAKHPDEPAGDGPGVNFVPGLRDFSISTESFDASSSDVEDGHVTPGEHRLLRFDTIIYNVGDADAEIGRPEDHPDLFEHSDSHGHAHMKGFNEYILVNQSGDTMDAGKKQTFCLRDNFRIPSRSNASNSSQYDCDYQGISAGWADVYDSTLPGQYLVIDGLPDGEYTLRATTNADGAIDETCTRDNTVRVDLRIENGTVTVIDTEEPSATQVDHRLAEDAHLPC